MKMNPIMRLIRRAALWVVFKSIPVDHPDAIAYAKECVESAYLEDRHSIRRALECYYWIRQIAD